MTPASRTWAALVHHPVVDKTGALVTTSVTNLDIHDIARASRTFGLAGYLVVTPITAQRELVNRIIGHWDSPEGIEQNDKRTEALRLVTVVGSLEEAIATVTEAAGRPPRVVATGARERGDVTSYRKFRESLESEPGGEPVLLLFGTGWGLAEQAFSKASIVLEPIRGASAYNHLSVRSAVAIVLDRLFGTR